MFRNNILVLEKKNLKYMLSLLQRHIGNADPSTLGDKYVAVSYHYTRKGVDLETFKVPVISASNDKYACSLFLHDEMNPRHMQAWICMKAKEIENKTAEVGVAPRQTLDDEADEVPNPDKQGCCLQ